MVRTRITTQAEVEKKTKRKGNKARLRSAVDKIATICNLTNPEKRAIMHRLTDTE
jgi:hypothetical protein